ncbi:Colanic acid polymerase WcaD [Citrobacter freundii]|uniref:Colanic acid polymerase WcaD n=1 Tax=Citrobacter freundii TaxID=546 RepID=A0A7G2IIJ9_CITFR|nr:Colanic acid polymerase WcaD [Citrobacter freundii]
MAHFMNTSRHSEFFNGADVGKTIDNGLYLLIIYFSWFAVILALWYMGKVMKMMINAFGDNQNYRVQLYLFTPLSLFFTGSVFSPEYAFFNCVSVYFAQGAEYREVTYMLLSIITVAFRNLEGIVKTHASLAHLAQAGDISFEWIVVDGGSSMVRRRFLKDSVENTGYGLSASRITASMMR